MAGGADDATTLAAYARAQARLEHAGGYAWREHASAVARGLGFRDSDLDRPLRDVLGRRDHARVARAIAQRRSRPASARRADEPPRRREPRVARARARLPRRRVHDRRARPLVPRGGHERDARARGRALDLLPGPLARLAPEKASVPSTRRRRPTGSPVDIARLERFVSRFRYKKIEGQAGAGQADADRPAGRRSGPEAAARPLLLARRTRGLGFDFGEPKRSGRDVLVHRGRGGGRRRAGAPADVTLRARTRRARRARRPERERQDNPHRGGRRRRLQARPRRRGRLLLAARDSSWTSAAASSTASRVMTGLTRPQAQMLLGRFLFSGWDAHMKQVRDLSGGERRRLGLAILVASGRQSPRPRRADEPSGPRLARDARGRARGLPGNGAARLARPRATRRRRAAHRGDRGRARCASTTAAGRTSSACARGAGGDEPAEPPPKEVRARPAEKPRRTGPDPLGVLEAEIEEKEREIGGARAEARDDWSDVDTIAAHGRARSRVDLAVRPLGAHARGGRGTAVVRRPASQAGRADCRPLRDDREPDSRRSRRRRGARVLHGPVSRPAARRGTAGEDRERHRGARRRRSPAPARSPR